MELNNKTEAVKGACYIRFSKSVYYQVHLLISYTFWSFSVIKIWTFLYRGSLIILHFHFLTTGTNENIIYSPFLFGLIGGAINQSVLQSLAGAMNYIWTSGIFYRFHVLQQEVGTQPTERTGLQSISRIKLMQCKRTYLFKLNHCQLLSTTRDHTEMKWSGPISNGDSLIVLLSVDLIQNFTPAFFHDFIATGWQPFVDEKRSRVNNNGVVPFPTLTQWCFYGFIGQLPFRQRRFNPHGGNVSENGLVSFWPVIDGWQVQFS